jgi:flagellin-like protein
MNLAKLRKNQRKAISPVIATIILIAVALIMALLVGVFAFGLFSSQTKNVTLQSGTMYASTGTFAGVLKNPGSSATTTTAGTISGPGCAAGTIAAGQAVAAGTTSPLAGTCGAAITAGDTYDYVINLANGQSISGSVVAQ